MEFMVSYYTYRYYGRLYYFSQKFDFMSFALVSIENWIILVLALFYDLKEYWWSVFLRLEESLWFEIKFEKVISVIKFGERRK